MTTLLLVFVTLRVIAAAAISVEVSGEGHPHARLIYPAGTEDRTREFGDQALALIVLDLRHHFRGLPSPDSPTAPNIP